MFTDTTPSTAPAAATPITSAAILILSDNGFEQSELEVPRDQLRDRGATVHVATPDGMPVRGWDAKDWGDTAAADLALADARAEDYDALVLPGGQMNPDLLRLNPAAITLISDFHAAGKPLAAVCHAPWLLIEAGLASGLRATSYVSIKTDDPYTIELPRALELIREKQEFDANRLILDFPEDGIQVLNGRYGPYITDKVKNAKIPKDRDPKTLTREECRELIAVAPIRPKRGAFGRPAAKTAAKEAAAPKKTAAKKPATPAKKASAKTVKRKTSKAST